MPHTISQNSSVLNNSLSVPSDGIDPVNESSVDPVFQSLLNNNFYLAYSQVCSRPHLTVTSINGTTIRVNPFNSLWVSTNNVSISTANWTAIGISSTSNLTNANLDIPGSFGVNTAYWIYAYASGTPGGALFEISVTQPDVTLTFKTGNITRRYIGSFITDGAGAIVPYEMNDLDYFLKISAGITVGPYTAGSPGTTVSISTTTGGFHYPATAKIIKIAASITNDGHSVGGGAGTVTYSNPGGAIGTTLTTYFGVTFPVITGYTTVVEVPISTASIDVNVTSDGTTNITSASYAIGYKE